MLSPEREAATDGVRSLNEEVGRDIPALEAKEDDPAPVANSDWREQVSAKVSKYKTATRHKVRYPSLQLPFEPGPYPAKSWAAEVSQTFSEPAPAETVKLQPSDWPEPRPPRISFEATARVLEFPRIAPPSIDPDALAEPLLDNPERHGSERVREIGCGPWRGGRCLNGDDVARARRLHRDMG